MDGRDRAGDACRALRGPRAEQGASGGLGSLRIYAINLLTNPFALNYSNNISCASMV